MFREKNSVLFGDSVLDREDRRMAVVGERMVDFWHMIVLRSMRRQSRKL
jgi:hypothetical protein